MGTRTLKRSERSTIDFHFPQRSLALLLTIDKTQPLYGIDQTLHVLLPQIDFFYSTLPNWIVDEDVNNGSTTRDLFQIISELFDDLHNKIKFLPTIKNINYSQGKPLPFSLKLLEDVGFEAIDIFSDITVLEEFLTRNETENYEETISNLKNYIYQNIYNILVDFLLFSL